MSDKLLQHIEDSVAKAVKVTVNGKIDALSAEVQQNREMNADTKRMLTEHIQANETFNKEITDTMEIVKDGLQFLNTGRRFFLWIGAPIITVGAAIAALKGLWK